jgi:hypothetical protein
MVHSVRMTSSMPFVLRVAAGVVAESLAVLRRLPTEITTLPVTALGQAAKLSFQLNQQLAELATSGDRLLAGLRSSETPERTSWSTIDEEDEVAAADPQAAPAWDDAADAAEDDPIADLADLSAARRAGRGGRGSAGPRGANRPGAAGSSGPRTGTPRAAGTRGRGPKPASASAANLVAAGDAEADARTQTVIDGIEAVEAPAAPIERTPRPASGSLSQLRARVREMSEPELRDALEFEQQHKARPAHLTLLSNRLATLDHHKSE